MKRKREEVRPFGQLSLPPPFFAAHPKVDSNTDLKQSKDDKVKLPSKSTVSLSEFLSRKQNKSAHKSLQEKRNSFSTCATASVQNRQESKVDRPEDVLGMFGNLKAVKGVSHAGSSRVDDNGCHNLECSFYEELEKGNDPILPPSIEGINKSTSRLVVLGEDPKPKLRSGPRYTREKHGRIFNHYANGSGWWDYNMEGVDNEEVGCNEPWEGMGTSTLGGLDWH